MTVLSNEDLYLLEQQVEDLEQETHVEFVPVFVRKAERYAQIAGRSYLVGGVSAATVLGGLILVPGLDSSSLGAWSPLVVLLSMLLSRWVFSFGGMGGFLVKNGEKEMSLNRRAFELFHEEKSQLPEGQPLVMIVVGVFERRVTVLASKHITSQLNPSDFEQVIDQMAPALKKKRFRQAMEVGLTAIARVLRNLQGLNAHGEGVDLENHPRLS